MVNSRHVVEQLGYLTEELTHEQTNVIITTAVIGLQ